MGRALDIGVTAWGALGSGVLTGKYNKDSSAKGRAAMWGNTTEQNLTIAQEVGHNPSQVALNWVRQQPGVIIPIIGAKTEAQAQDNLGCLEFTLTPDQITRLNEVSQIELGFPYNFLASDEVKDLVYGGTFSKIDNHRS